MCKRCWFKPWVRKIPWSRKWQSLQYSFLENSMDRGSWWATVHVVANTWTWLSNWAHILLSSFLISSRLCFIVLLLSCVWLCVIPWAAVCQDPLSFTVSWSLLRFTFIESVMISNHLILRFRLLLLPPIFPIASGSFPMSQLFASPGGQNIGISASTSVLPMNIQG